MEIADKIAIQELNYRYALHIDFHQTEEWVALFTEDGVLDELEYGLGVHDGHAAIRAYAQSLAASVIHAVHLVPNILVKAAGPDEATGTVFALVEAITRDNGHMRYQLYYEDRYVKRGGNWLFKRRVIRKTFPPEVVGSSVGSTAP